jgi:hypothetical protein
MKEAEGGVVALDPHRLSTVVLELHRRGRRMKEAERGIVDQDPVRDSAADFARHQGARDFARRQGAHPDSALTPDPQGATEEA